MSARTDTLAIQIPEGIVFTYPLAGVMTRFLAWLIDFFCVMAIILLLSQAISALKIVSPDIATAVQTVIFFVLQIGYGMVLEWRWRGQTFGKKALRLRVIDRQGLRLQPYQVILRNLLRLIDSLPISYLVGGVAMLTSRYAQRLGDFAANTVVVRTEELSGPDLQALFGGKYNSLLAHRHLAARLRQRVSPQVASIALQALLRRDEFEPIARLQLFEQLSRHFQALVEFPPEATEGLSDEQYVTNVAQILHRA